MRVLVSLLFSLTVMAAHGQGLRARARIEPVTSEGFYRALLTPAISQHLEAGAINVRIIDSQGQEVPYLYSIASPRKFTTTLREYEILERKQVSSCCTTWILSNPSRGAINNISLVIKNAEVTKKASLLGSDDKITWYAVKQQFVIASIASQTETSEVRMVDFPLSNYLYYSLQVSDSTTAPLNILRAGYYDVSEEQGEYTPVPIARITQVDSAGQKKTYLSLTFDHRYWIDRIDLSMKGQPYFLRAGTLFERDTRTNRQGVAESFFRARENFQLSSTHITQLEIPLHSDAFRISIDNQDNPPLEIQEVKALQLNRYVTAWLKKGENYTLEFGDETWTKPAYDLDHFKASIPVAPPLLTLDPIQVVSAATEESNTFFSTRTYIWAAIVAVIVLLGYMSVNLLRSIGKN
ncbi:MAG: hypothetical protein JNN04_10390 [Cyclobacteriaceae bacterium]|nr:hypothetical protein [Cyclobacteriaceae bacterium]